jgi:hypothetical protein
MEESAKELFEYKEASKVIIPWLERTDPELYNVAKTVPPTKHFFCSCHSGKRLQEIHEEDQAWILTLGAEAESKSASSSSTTPTIRKRARK